jgi:hypothetical protein
MLSSSDKVTSLWEFLSLFFTQDRIKSWRDEIFEENGTGIETCVNLITLSPTVHAAWQQALFALKPLELSNDKKRLTLQFFWLPKNNITNDVDVLRRPDPMASLEGVDGFFLFDFRTNRRISSGHIITMETDDPIAKPLPSFKLLEMQWILQRFMSMSGAAEPVEIPYEDDDDEYDYEYDDEYDDRERDDDGYLVDRESR